MISQMRIVELSEMLLELLDATDLSDEESDVVCEILLTKLWQRSGLDALAFRTAVSVVISNQEWATSRRH